MCDERWQRQPCSHHGHPGACMCVCVCMQTAADVDLLAEKEGVNTVFSLQVGKWERSNLTHEWWWWWWWCHTYDAGEVTHLVHHHWHWARGDQHDRFRHTKSRDQNAAAAQPTDHSATQRSTTYRGTPPPPPCLNSSSTLKHRHRHRSAGQRPRFHTHASSAMGCMWAHAAHAWLSLRLLFGQLFDPTMGASPLCLCDVHAGHVGGQRHGVLQP